MQTETTIWYYYRPFKLDKVKVVAISNAAVM